MAGNNLNTLYRKRLVDPRMKEGIREPLYDFLTYDSAATLQLKFFQTQVGGAKTKSDTNMPLNGQLPAGQKFVAQTLELHFMPGSNAGSYVRQAPVQSATALAAPNFANDVWALVNQGWLEVTVGTKQYLTAPLIAFPSSSGLVVQAAIGLEAVAAAAAAIENQITVDYARLGGRVFQFTPEVPIEPQTNFDVTLNWPAAVTLPSGFDARIGVSLGGVRFRN